MMHDRLQMRKTILTAWQKAQNNEPLTPLEKDIASVIQYHPDYHALLNNSEKTLHADFETHNNPFLHLSLHISLREQIRCDRPSGMKKRWLNASRYLLDTHDLEHKIMQVIAELLCQAQQEQRTIDDSEYLTAIENVLPKSK